MVLRASICPQRTPGFPQESALGRTVGSSGFLEVFRQILPVRVRWLAEIPPQQERTP